METRTTWNILKETVQQWLADDAATLAASLAFYTAISIAPLLIMVIVVASIFVSRQQVVENQLMTYLTNNIGAQGAQFIQNIINNAEQPSASTIAGIVSLVTLIWGSTNVFTQLQNTLNKIWNVDEQGGSGIWNTLQERFLAFAMVLGIAFLLLLSLVISAVLSTIATSFSNLLGGMSWLWQLVDFLISFGVITLLFAAVFKVLPDVELAWRDVWLGAGVTALLFVIGKFLLGFYLGNATSAYGAAGSLIAFLLWVYYSAQILFFGAEFTQVYTGRDRNSAVAS
ncbi:MAG: YihY/virulence factor BrkB family protein [Caldilineaceae bacterium]